MRSLQRIRVFLVEAGVFGLGVLFSFVVTIMAHLLGWEWFEIPELPVFLLGACASLVGFLLYRRKTRAWRIQYDAESWQLSRAARRLHPTRSKVLSICRRTLIWLPSAIAGFVLLFFPPATHLVHPSSQYLEHYRIRIPWTYAVYPSSGWGWDLASILKYSRQAYNRGTQAVVSSNRRGRFGMTPFLVLPFWNTQQKVSVIVFSSDPNWVVPQAAVDASTDPATHVRAFRLGGVELTCWQYPWPYGSETWPASEFTWVVNCNTPTGAGRWSFHAHYYGRDEDLPAFYRLIESVTPVP
jgi:hypothetical protein